MKLKEGVYEEGLEGGKVVEKYNYIVSEKLS